MDKKNKQYKLKTDIMHNQIGRRMQIPEHLHTSITFCLIYMWIICL